MSEEPSEMQVQKPTFKNEFNLTTAAVALGMVVTLGGWIWSASSTTTELKSGIAETNRRFETFVSERFTKYVEDHSALHKDRLAAVTGENARTDQRLTGLETNSRKVDQLEYRMTVQEQGAANMNRSLEELKTNVNTLGADVRVMLEILKRQDNKPNGK